MPAGTEVVGDVAGAGDADAGGLAGVGDADGVGTADGALGAVDGVADDAGLGVRFRLDNSQVRERVCCDLMPDACPSRNAEC